MRSLVLPDAIASYESRSQHRAGEEKNVGRHVAVATPALGEEEKWDWDTWMLPTDMVHRPPFGPSGDRVPLLPSTANPPPLPMNAQQTGYTCI